MGVELNFISRKRRELKAAWVLGLTAVLSFGLLAGVVYQQWNAALVASTATPVVEPAYDMAMELSRLDANAAPHIALFEEVQSVLGDGANIVAFDFDGDQELRVSATFSAFEDVQSATRQLQALRYVRSVNAGDSDEMTDGYYAAWVLALNGSALHVLRMEKEAE